MLRADLRAARLRRRRTRRRRPRELHARREAGGEEKHGEDGRRWLMELGGDRFSELCRNRCCPTGECLKQAAALDKTLLPWDLWTQASASCSRWCRCHASRQLHPEAASHARRRAARRTRRRGRVAAASAMLSPSTRRRARPHGRARPTLAEGVVARDEAATAGVGSVGVHGLAGAARLAEHVDRVGGDDNAVGGREERRVGWARRARRASARPGSSSRHHQPAGRRPRRPRRRACAAST